MKRFASHEHQVGDVRKMGDGNQGKMIANVSRYPIDNRKLPGYWYLKFGFLLRSFAGAQRKQFQSRWRFSGPLADAERRRGHNLCCVRGEFSGNRHRRRIACWVGADRAQSLNSWRRMGRLVMLFIRAQTSRF
jgi:hypothetical protein